MNSRRFMPAPKPNRSHPTDLFECLIGAENRPPYCSIKDCQMSVPGQKRKSRRANGKPLYPQEQTSSGLTGMFERCQQRKWYIHSITSSANDSNVSGTDIARSPPRR